MTTHASETGQQSAKDRAADVGGTAKEQTSQVAGTAKEQAAGVAGTAKEQAVDVAHDAVGQARNLLDELRQNVRTQVGTQRNGLAQTLDGYANELRQMAERSDSDGPATEAVRQIASRLSDIKNYLDGDGDIASDVRRFARRRPGAFLLACAAAGVLAGRATRGAAAARKVDQGGGRHVIDVREPGTPGDIAQYRTGAYTAPGDYGTQTYGTGDYGTPSGTGPTYGTGTSGTEYGAGTAAGEPLAGIERTSDPNLRATSGPLGGGSYAAGDPVPPDLGPGPTGIDEEITRDGQESTTTWERGER